MNYSSSTSFPSNFLSSDSSSFSTSPTSSQLPSHPVTPSRNSESRGGSSVNTYHTLPHVSLHGMGISSPMWGPLEPPSTPKPWSLSCLRPAPPLRPSAALCYKEVLDFIVYYRIDIAFGVYVLFLQTFF